MNDDDGARGHRLLGGGRGADPAPPLGRSLTHDLVEVLGLEAVVGRLDGEILTEALLAARFGVSRSVVREACKMLASKGLFGSRPRQGTRVLPRRSWNFLDADVTRWLMFAADSTSRAVVHAVELRVVVEPAAAVLAAQNTDVDRPVPLTRLADEIAEAEKTGVGDLAARRIAFHVEVLRASENPFLLCCRHLVSTSLRAAHAGLYAATAVAPSYAQLAVAIVEGDPVAAERLMRSVVTCDGKPGNS